VRVHEELSASGAVLSYQALTAFCRRQQIGKAPVVRAGRYYFEPGVEMQHDTSPHEVEVGGKKYKAQTASAVLCYSRLLFFQLSPTFQRFDCKVFLTEALHYMGGAPRRIMIDKSRTSVQAGASRRPQTRSGRLQGMLLSGFCSTKVRGALLSSSRRASGLNTYERSESRPRRRAT
jgi:hypothetical protein